MANQRKEARPRRRVPERHEVHAGPAIGDARQIDAVLVDVVGALQPIEDTREVVDLRRRPPERSHPSDRKHQNLVDTAGQRVGPNAVDDRRARARDAAVQLKPHLIGTGRVVRLGDDEHVLVIEAVERAMAADLQSARHVGVMVAPAPHARQRVFERHACFENRRRFARLRWRVAVRTRTIGTRDRWRSCGRGLLRRRGKRDGKAAGDHSEAYGRPTFARALRRRATVAQARPHYRGSAFPQGLGIRD